MVAAIKRFWAKNKQNVVLEFKWSESEDTGRNAERQSKKIREVSNHYRNREEGQTTRWSELASEKEYDSSIGGGGLVL